MGVLVRYRRPTITGDPADIGVIRGFRPDRREQCHFLIAVNGDVVIAKGQIINPTTGQTDRAVQARRADTYALTTISQHIRPVTGHGQAVIGVADHRTIGLRQVMAIGICCSFTGIARFRLLEFGLRLQGFLTGTLIEIMEPQYHHDRQDDGHDQITLIHLLIGTRAHDFYLSQPHGAAASLRFLSLSELAGGTGS